MEPELDSPIVGVDILQCPIEETASQLQKFPCRISDAREFTFPDPRRIAQDGTFLLRLLIPAHPKFLLMPVTSQLSFDLQDSLLCVFLKGL